MFSEFAQQPNVLQEVATKFSPIWYLVLMSNDPRKTASNITLGTWKLQERQRPVLPSQ